MQLSNNELELLSTYQNWLKKNKLNDKCNAYFISQTSMLVFQVWDLEKLISETMEWQPFLGLFFGRHLFLIIKWS